MGAGQWLWVAHYRLVNRGKQGEEITGDLELLNEICRQGMDKVRFRKSWWRDQCNRLRFLQGRYSWMSFMKSHTFCLDWYLGLVDLHHQHDSSGDAQPAADVDVLRLKPSRFLWTSGQQMGHPMVWTEVAGSWKALKGGELYRGLPELVLCILSLGQEVTPLVLVMITEKYKGSKLFLVSFHLPIALGVIYWREAGDHTQEFEEGPPYVIYKLKASVIYNILLNPTVAEHVTEQKFGRLHCSR